MQKNHQLSQRIASNLIMDTTDDPAQPLHLLKELETTENFEGKKLENNVGVNAEESCSKEDKLPPTMCAPDENDKTIPITPDVNTVIFKKPVVIVRSIQRKLKDKVQRNCHVKNIGSSKPDVFKLGTTCHIVDPNKDTDANLLAPIPYTEPSWAGYPSRVYSFEIIKGGQIIENFDLSLRSCHAIGRSPINDVVLLHPTISRFHAVIQFRDDDKGTPEDPSGMYIYDMGSTHGTFLNKMHIKPRMYVRVHVGHILKFGASSRHFLLKGPQEDQEEESLLSVTQIQNQRNNELIKRKLDAIKGKVADDEQGINWGMDDDADEETDLSINPFALTNNEELYMEDPKKTLRGWFEREGHELLYNVEEKSPGNFRCFVEIPLETCLGRSHIAEAIVHGKKKEAVLQCALEACRVLDRCGVLRQATHESKKRKAKDWEADDYYDSDDDMFLDRTGIIEKKRQTRIAAFKEKPDSLSYAELVGRHQQMIHDLRESEEKLSKLRSTNPKKAQPSESISQDPLDAYMDSLDNCKEATDSVTVSKLKMKIKNLKAECAMCVRLLEKASPSLGMTNPNGKTVEFRELIPRKEADELAETSQEFSSEAGNSDYKIETDRVCQLDQLSDAGVSKDEEKVDEEKKLSREGQEEAKKKKRNRTRNKLRSLKAWKGQNSHEFFSDWTPPQGQSGDGKTKLNEKLGY